MLVLLNLLQAREKLSINTYNNHIILISAK